MTGRIYKLRANHISNSDFDGTLYALLGVFLFAANNEWGTE